MRKIIHNVRRIHRISQFYSKFHTQNANWNSDSINVFEISYTKRELSSDSVNVFEISYTKRDLSSNSVNVFEISYTKRDFSSDQLKQIAGLYKDNAARGVKNGTKPVDEALACTQKIVRVIFPDDLCLKYKSL